MRLKKAGISNGIARRNKAFRIAAAMLPNFSNKEVSRATGLPESEVERIVGSDKRKSKYPRSELRKAVALELAGRPEKPMFKTIAGFLNVSPTTVTKWAKGMVKRKRGKRPREQPPSRFCRIRELIEAGKSLGKIARILGREEGRRFSRQAVHSLYTYWASPAKRQEILQKGRAYRQPSRMSGIEGIIERQIREEGIKGWGKRTERMKRFIEIADQTRPPKALGLTNTVINRIKFLERLIERLEQKGNSETTANHSRRVKELQEALKNAAVERNAEKRIRILQNALERK